MFEELQSDAVTALGEDHWLVDEVHDAHARLTEG
jgi:hypothetical protein